MKLDEFEMKEETVFIKEEGSILEDTCTVYVQGESMKMETLKLKSKIFFSLFYLLYIYVKNIIIFFINKFIGCNKIMFQRTVTGLLTKDETSEMTLRKLDCLVSCIYDSQNL